MEQENVSTDSIGGGVTGNSGGKVDPVQKKWLKRLKKEKECHKDFRDRCEDVEKVFRRTDFEKPLYVPLYWQVVNVEHVGVYSNQPVPDVRPRNEINNPKMRKIAKLIQRGLAYCIDQPSFDENMHRTVDDYLAMGLGIIRAKVDSIIFKNEVKVPVFKDVPMPQDMMDMAEMPNMGMVMPQQGMMQVQVGEETKIEETYGDQFIRWEFVPWSCFGWQPCNNWKHCDFIYFRHPMTQEEIKKRWDKIVSATKGSKSEKTEGWQAKTYDIYEIWDRQKKEVIFLAEGESEPLEIIPDPLELLEFYPCPTPMMMNLPSDELIPQSDYDYVEPYDVELNDLQERRMGLMSQIRATGAFDPGMPELADMFENEDGEYTSVPNLMQRISAVGGVENLLIHLPITEKATVLQTLTDQISFIRAQVDEVLGISDIVMGVTKASETATAQEIKGRWVGVRLTRKRETVQYTVREIMRITAQLLSSHITPDNLQRMTQMQISEEELQLMSDDILMDFAIDIETDSTVAKDEMKEMATKQEMLNGVAQYAQSVLPMVQQNMLPAGVASAILRSALNPYAKYDRDLEEELGTLPQTLQQMTDLTQKLQKAEADLATKTQEATQWETVAIELQNKATEAATHQKHADALKKEAETAEIKEGLSSVAAQADQNVEKSAAETLDILARASSYEDDSEETEGSGSANSQT